jgi:hypothetical protein
MFSLIVSFLISMSLSMSANQTTTPPPAAGSSTTQPTPPTEKPADKKPVKSDPAANSTGGTGHWSEGG